MEERINTSELSDKYFKYINDCIQLTTIVNNIFSTEQILQTVYYVIITTRLYTNVCKEWRRKSNEQKIWENFKQTFSKEYYDLKEQQQTTSMQAGYHQSKMMEDNQMLEFMNIFYNFAHVVTSDKNTIAYLVETHAKLVEANKMLGK